MSEPKKIEERDAESLPKPIDLTPLTALVQEWEAEAESDFRRVSSDEYGEYSSALVNCASQLAAVLARIQGT